MACTARVLVYASGGAEHSDIAPTLAANGFETRFVAPGTPANDRFDPDETDLVIIDCQDFKSGAENSAIDLTRSLKTSPRTRPIPVIVIDSQDDGNRQVEVLSAGADEYIARPFHECQLLGRLGCHLRLATMREELVRRAETSRKYGVDQEIIDPPEAFQGGVQLLVVAGRGDSFSSLETAMGVDTDLTFAWSSQTALDYLNRRSFDAALIDMDSQDGEALGLCSQIRSYPSLSTLPVLVFGDRLGFDDPSEAFRAGADDVLYRPLGDDELKTRIRALVTHQRYRRALHRVYNEGRHLITSDALTRLYSHGYLLEHLKDQIAFARDHDRNLSIAFFDIHQMRTINRQYGYATGDKIIRQVGVLISRLVRGEDLPARYGGEEFCVALPDTGQRAGSMVVSRLLNVVNFTEFAGADSSEACTLRLKGCAVQMNADDTPESLIERARASLQETPHRPR
jgi:two-component system cell cycle response regulator